MQAGFVVRILIFLCVDPIFLNRKQTEPITPKKERFEICYYSWWLTASAPIEQIKLFSNIAQVKYYEAQLPAGAVSELCPLNVNMVNTLLHNRKQQHTCEPPSLQFHHWTCHNEIMISPFCKRGMAAYLRCSRVTWPRQHSLIASDWLLPAL